MTDELDGRGEPVARRPMRRWPVITVLVVVIVLVAGALVIATRSHDASVASSTAVTFTGHLPPVVLTTSSSTAGATTSDALTTDSSLATQSPPSSGSVSSPADTTASSVATATSVPPGSTDTTVSTTTTTTSATTVPTTTTTPQCFVPAQISIVFDDGTTPKIGVSGDGVSSRTFSFQFGRTALTGNATIDGLKDCGTHYLMAFQSADGSTQSVCGPPPTLSEPIHTSTPSDTATITVKPAPPGC